MLALWLHFGPLLQWAVRGKKSFEYHIKAPLLRIQALKDTILATELAVDPTLFLEKSNFSFSKNSQSIRTLMSQMVDPELDLVMGRELHSVPVCMRLLCQLWMKWREYFPMWEWGSRSWQ